MPKQEYAQTKKYNESGYAGRFASNAEKVGGAFANAGTGMVEALKGLAKSKADTPENIKFARAIEAARQGGNPSSGEAPGFSGKTSTSLAGMTPDVAGGVLAGAVGGPAATVGYWTARQYPERREDYAALGLNPNAAAAAGGASALAESALWAIDRDPTGLTQGMAAPLKGFVKKIAEKAVEKVGVAAAAPLVNAAVEAAAHTGLGMVRTGAQAVVREGGKALAGSGKSAGEIISEAASETAQAAPALAVMSGVGGGSKLPTAFAEAKHTRVQAEIMQADADGISPSRMQWKEWGLPVEEGLSRKNRQEVVGQLAESYRTLEQVRTVIEGDAPTVDQWKRWGLPTEDGKTEEQRQAFLKEKFAPPAPESSPTQNVGTSEQVPTAAPQGETLATEQSGAKQPEANARLDPAINSEQQTTVPRLPADKSAPVPTDPALADAQAAQGTSPARHDFPVDMEGTGERIGGREVVRELEQIWGVPLRSGRLGTAKARGIYKLGSQVARLAKGEESSSAVVAHEAIGHHLDNTTDILKSAPADAQQEVGMLDYDTSKNRPSEGFAEFVRAYLTGGAERFKSGIDLSQATPKFLDHFNRWLDAHPDVKAKMESSRGPIEAFQKAGAVGRVKGQISETGIDREHPAPFMERVNEWKEYLYTRFKDEGRPLQRFVNEAENRGYNPGDKTTPYEDYNALRQIGPHFAARAIEDGVFKLTGQQEKIGPSLTEALREITPKGVDKGEDYANFTAWAYARHAIESWGKGKNPGITLEDAKEAGQRLYDPRYVRAANAVTQYNNALIDVLADVGAIDAASAERIKSSYQTYIPLERAKEGAVGGVGRHMVDLSAAIKVRRGSGLQIIDPIESTLARSIRLYERASQQVVINKLVSVASRFKGLGGWVEEVPKKVVATTFSVDEIKSQLEKAAQTSPDFDIEQVKQMLDEGLDPATVLTVWRPDLAKIHGVPIVRVSIDGQPRFFQVHPELAEALGGLDTLQHLDFFTKTARWFTGIMKIGATRLNPDFILKNALRDFDTFIMQGEKGLAGAFDPAKYATAYIAAELQKARGEKGDPAVELYQKMGGELSTYIGLDRNRLKAGVERALAGKQGKMETALNIAGAHEIGPRLAEFSAILQKEGWMDRVKQGETPPMETLVRAINAAHDVTVDFRRMGKWGRYANYWVPFFNARLEGIDKFTRTWKDNPARSLMRAGQWMATRAMLYWWWRHNDDDYKERPEWQDGFFILKDAQGNPTIRIPKSQEWGAVESGVERMMDAMHDKDPAAMTRWFNQVVGTVNPMGLPSGVTPAFESYMNYDTFRGRPVVSQGLQKLQAPDQYYEYTSKLAKAAARTLHDASGGKVSLSPAQIDHLADGLTGGLYNTITSTTEKGVGLLQGQPIGIGEVPGLKGLALRKDYAKSVDDFYTQKEVIDKAHESKNLREPKGERNLYAEDLTAWQKMQNVSTLMTSMRKAAHDLPAADKAKAELAMTGLARAALSREPLERYPNPLADPSAVPDAVQAVIRDHIAQHAITASSSSPGSDAREAAAVKYLHAMGVSGPMAQDLAYTRLRSQGVNSEAAHKRVSQILLPNR